MVTKKLKIIVKSHGSYEAISKICASMGVTVTRKSYDVALNVYVFMIEVTKEQALELLSYVKLNEGLLLKDE